MSASRATIWRWYAKYKRAYTSMKMDKAREIAAYSRDSLGVDFEEMYHKEGADPYDKNEYKFKY